MYRDLCPRRHANHSERLQSVVNVHHFVLLQKHFLHSCGFILELPETNIGTWNLFITCGPKVSDRMVERGRFRNPYLFGNIHVHCASQIFLFRVTCAASQFAYYLY